jgi:5-methylthioadenosine/S-adenosylhomocysteine deaminase
LALVLEGTVVTFDANDRVLDPGRVYIADDGTLEAVSPRDDPAPTGFDAAPRVATGGVIYPGLIDLHNHMGYNTIPLWEAPGVPYMHHDSWPGEKHAPDYSGSISWPSKVLQQAAPEALIKYVEVRALTGGTTSIQGAPHTTRPVDGWLLRVIDNQAFPPAPDRVLVSALQKPLEKLVKDAPKLTDRHVLIYHAAEGQPGSIVHQEFDDLDSAGCLAPGLMAVHATALTAADFAAWQKQVADSQPGQQGTVVWSPFSNLFLYHVTTDVKAAHDAGLRIALGSDWAPSGTKHVLGELKVADLVKPDGAFSDADLCAMVTANAGDALAWAWDRPRVGRLLPGAEADLVVMQQRDDDVHRNLIEATERQIRLVLVRGTPFYGTPQLMSAAGAKDADPITVAGVKRQVVVRQPGRADAQLDWAGVLKRLEEVRKDPIGAWHASQDALASWGGALDDPDAPLAIFGDMPEGDIGVMGAVAEPPPNVKIPRLDSLVHDKRFFDAVDRAGPPELAGLRQYYA